MSAAPALTLAVVQETPADVSDALARLQCDPRQARDGITVAECPCCETGNAIEVRCGAHRRGSIIACSNGCDGVTIVGRLGLTPLLGIVEEEAAKPDDALESPFAALYRQALAEVRAYAHSKSDGSHDAPAFEPAAALLAQDFPPTPWLIRGVLVEGAVSATAGEAKTAKTWAVLEQVMALATGTNAFGHYLVGRPRHAAVFLVEDDGRSVRNRLRALAAGRDMAPADAVARISVKCRGRLNLQRDDDLAWIIASCRALPEKLALLALDPLRDLHNAKEDKSDEMAPVMGRLRLLRDVVGCAVLFVHHTAKAGEQTNARRPGQRMRGSGAVHASVDGGLYLSGLDTDGAGRFESTADVELKAVRGAGQFSLRLDVTDDDDGEAIEARWTVTQPQAANSGDDGLERAQAEVLKVLKGEWLFASGKPRTLSVAAVRAKVKKQTQVVNAALAQLQAEGRAEQVMQGRKALGWRFVPSTVDRVEHDDGAGPTISRPFPEARETTARDPFPPLIGGKDLGPESTDLDPGNGSGAADA